MPRHVRRGGRPRIRGNLGCGRPRSGARRTPRTTRAGPSGELPGEGDDGEPSSRRLAVASRSRGGA
jgi:hypothetical protein